MNQSICCRIVICAAKIDSNYQSFLKNHIIDRYKFLINFSGFNKWDIGLQFEKSNFDSFL